MRENFPSWFKHSNVADWIYLYIKLYPPWQTGDSHTDFSTESQSTVNGQPTYNMCSSYPFGTVSTLTFSKCSYTGQGESSLQNFVISIDVELEGDSGRWPYLDHGVNHVIL